MNRSSRLRVVGVGLPNPLGWTRRQFVGWNNIGGLMDVDSTAVDVRTQGVDDGGTMKRTREWTTNRHRNDDCCVGKPFTKSEHDSVTNLTVCGRSSRSESRQGLSGLRMVKLVWRMCRLNVKCESVKCAPRAIEERRKTIQKQQTE